MPQNPHHQVSEAGRPLCLIQKMRNPASKYNQTMQSPHETFEARNHDLLNLSQTTEEETHHEYYEVEVDSSHIKEKYNRH